MSDFRAVFGFGHEEICHETSRLMSKSTVVRMTHLPTGEVVEYERPRDSSVHEFNRQMLAELAERVRSSDSGAPPE